MNDDDIKKIGKLLDQKLEGSEKKVDDKFTNFEQKIYQKFDNFEKKVDDKFTNFEQKVDLKFQESEKRIAREIGNFIEQSILPQLEEKADKADIERIERKIDLFSAKVTDHDHRLKSIESLPTIAHELKLNPRKN